MTGQVYKHNNLMVIYDGQSLRWLTSNGVKTQPVMIAKDLLSLDFKKVHRMYLSQGILPDKRNKIHTKKLEPLGEHKAWEIYERYKRQGEASKDLSEEYQVTQRTVQYIGKQQMYKETIESLLEKI